MKTFRQEGGVPDDIREMTPSLQTFTRDRRLRRLFGSGGFSGHPPLHQVNLFLTLPALERWRAERTLPFPPGCCVCSRPPDHWLSSYVSPRWLGALRRKEVLTRVPHCASHGRGDEAQLVALVTSWSEWVCHVSLIGLNENFLSETQALNQAGDLPPPWRAFPGYDPIASGWRQGNGEFWFLHAWLPFWTPLPEAERQHYLLRWEASEDWRSWLTRGL